MNFVRLMYRNGCSRNMQRKILKNSNILYLLEYIHTQQADRLLRVVCF